MYPGKAPAARDGELQGGPADGYDLGEVRYAK